MRNLPTETFCLRIPCSVLAVNKRLCNINLLIYICSFDVCRASKPFAGLQNHLPTLTLRALRYFLYLISLTWYGNFNERIITKSTAWITFCRQAIGDNQASTLNWKSRLLPQQSKPSPTNPCLQIQCPPTQWAFRSQWRHSSVWEKETFSRMRQSVYAIYNCGEKPYEASKIALFQPRRFSHHHHRILFTLGF